MYQVLARKYRPKILDEIIGQDSIVQILKNAILNDRIAHAYIFSGTRGVGKTSIARILAKSINCVNGPTINPCGVCEPCIAIQNGNAVDVLEIDGASNTGVDAIRDLKENIIYTPQSFKYKIYIIDEVHMLSNSAFNALLKTLEEPPAHAKFIFATTELHKVPETILSRCQRFNFKRIPINLIYSKLKEVAEKEDISITDENLMTIASLADGSIRDSLSTFDTVISYYGNNIKEDISSVLGLTVKKTILSLIETIFKKDYENSIKTAREIYESGADMRQFIKQLAFYIRNILIIKLKYKDLVNDITDEEINLLIPAAEQKNKEELLDMIEILLTSETKYQKISHPLLMFELTIFRLMNVPNKRNITELLNKIDKLDKYDKIIDCQTNIECNEPALSPVSEPKKREMEADFAKNVKIKQEFNPAPAAKSYRDDDTNPEPEIGGSQMDKLFTHFDKIDEQNSKTRVNPAKGVIKENNNDDRFILNCIKDVFKSDIERIDKLEE